MGLTDLGKKLQKRLQNRECYPSIFQNEVLAAEGTRNQTLTRYIGQAISLIYPMEDSSPDWIYALFLNPCLSMGRDQDGTPWEQKAWDIILRLWASEEVSVEEEKEVVQGTVAEVMKGLREWSDVPDDDVEALKWLNEHLLISWGRYIFVLKPNGYYDQIAVLHVQLIARIRELGMEGLIPTTYVTTNGAQKYRDAGAMISEHAAVIKNVEGRVSSKGGIITDDDTLCLGLYGRRTDLIPEWSKEVDEWLQQLCPEQSIYVKLCNWIGHSLAFEDGPICALSLAGPPGIGKKLFSWGLAECITTQTVADAKEFGRFSPMLQRTPFVVVNEGFPTMGFDSKDPADTFRAFTSGDPINSESKFQNTIVIRSPLRVMIFANNLSVLRSLTSNRDLSPDDREALAQRLFHIDAPHDAAEWLRHKGGLQYTGRPGAKWIRGDDGSESDSIIAKHFLWLYENKEPVPYENRFLVEGDRNAEVIRMLSTQSGFAPEIIECVVKMVEVQADNIPGLVVQDRDIYVTVSGVVAYHRAQFYRTSGIALKTKSVASVLRGLTASGWDPQHATIIKKEKGKVSQRACWWKLKADTLYREALDNGYACKQLDKIVNPPVEVTPEGLKSVLEGLQNGSQ